MALFDEYFDASFERGESAFNQTFGTYIGTLLKENKEAYARELKAADPTDEYEALKDLRDQRSDLYRQLRDPSSSRGGDTQTHRTGAASAAEAKLELQEENRSQQDLFNIGVAAASASGSAGGKILDFVEGEVDPSDPSKIATAVQDTINHIKLIPGTGTAVRTRAGAHGVGEGIIQYLNDNDVDSAIITAVENALPQTHKPPPDDLARYMNPEEMTIEQDKQLDLIRKGVTTTRKYINGGDRLPAGTSKSLMMGEIEKLDAAIKRQEEIYREAKDAYRSLATNPGRNFATAPIASRPSRLSRALEVYGEYRTADPIAAEEMMETSRAEEELTVPDRFRALPTIEGAGGKSPIDIIMDSTKTISMVRGPRFDPDDGRSSDYDLTYDDVELVKGSLQRMQRAFKSPMFGEQKYGDVFLDDSKKNKMPIGQFVDGALEGFEDPRLTKEMQAQYAQSISDKLIEWQTSQDEKTLKSARRDYNPSSAVSGSIRKIQTAKSEFDKTGDQRVLNQTIADEYNIINSTDSEIRGGVGDAFLKQVDDFMATPARDRRMDLFSSGLVDLQSKADEMSVRDVRGESL